MKSYYRLALFVYFSLISTNSREQCPGTATAATPGATFSNTPIAEGTNWNQPQHAQANDGSFATASVTVAVLQTLTSNYLTAAGFGFSIPPTATICGVTVSVVRQRQDLLGGVITDNSVKLVASGSISGIDHASGANWSTAVQTVNYGSSSDTWGISLTPAIVNNSNFGVAISAKFNGGLLISLLQTAAIDYISIIINYTISVLPIRLTDFSVTRQGYINLLNWKAASSTDGDHFIVQRSGDSRYWESLDTIPALPADQRYTYADNDPLPGINFYRLFLVNNDGEGVYSYIRDIMVSAPPVIRCYPNVVIDKVNVSSSMPIHKVVLRDLQGRSLCTRTPGEVTYVLQVPMDGLPRGFYILIVDNVLFRITKR